MEVRRWFQRNARARHVMADVGHTRFIFFSPGGGEFCHFSYKCSLKRFFLNTGGVRRRLCCRPSLLLARSSITCVLTILWATPGARNSLKLALWGLLWATNCALSEKRDGNGAETIGSRRFFNSNNNQPINDICGWGLSEKARDRSEMCGGELSRRLGRRYGRQKKN